MMMALMMMIVTLPNCRYMVTKKEYVSGSETDEEPELKKPMKKVEKVGTRSLSPLTYLSF